MRVGINGFGRIGRLVFRALWGRSDIELVHINERAGDAATAAHLLEFDSVHGRWNKAVAASGGGLQVESQAISYSQASDPAAVPWQELGVELVLECSGKIKTPEALEPYITDLGVERVIVACPVKGMVAGEEVLNIVYGINHGLVDPARHRVITAASCTTNCLAPVVQVVHENFGIRHGSITTLHDVTNTQVVIDSFKSDLRRARSCLQSLIPTSTGSARAIGLIFPELQGKLNDITQRFAHETRFIANACAAPVRAVPMDRASYASAFTHGDPVYMRSARVAGALQVCARVRTNGSWGGRDEGCGARTTVRRDP